MQAGLPEVRCVSILSKHPRDEKNATDGSPMSSAQQSIIPLVWPLLQQGAWVKLAFSSAGKLGQPSRFIEMLTTDFVVIPQVNPPAEPSPQEPLDTMQLQKTLLGLGAQLHTCEEIVSGRPLKKPESVGTVKPRPNVAAVSVAVRLSETPDEVVVDPTPVATPVETVAPPPGVCSAVDRPWRTAPLAAPETPPSAPAARATYAADSEDSDGGFDEVAAFLDGVDPLTWEAPSFARQVPPLTALASKPGDETSWGDTTSRLSRSDLLKAHRTTTPAAVPPLSGRLVGGTALVRAAIPEADPVLAAALRDLNFDTGELRRFGLEAATPAEAFDESQVVQYRHRTSLPDERRLRKRRRPRPSASILSMRSEGDESGAEGLVPQQTLSAFATDPSTALFQISPSIKGELKQQVIAAIVQLGAVPNFSTHYEPSATHLIGSASHMERTEKFLSFRASGKPIVTADYVLDSARVGKLLAEAPYSTFPIADLPPLHVRPFEGWRVALFATAQIYKGIATILQAGGCEKSAIFVAPFQTKEEALLNDDNVEWIRRASKAQLTHLLVEVDMTSVVASRVSGGSAGQSPIASPLTYVPPGLRSAVPPERVFSLELLFQVLCTHPDRQARQQAIVKFPETQLAIP